MAHQIKTSIQHIPAEPGQRILVKVLEVDMKRKRISLTMKGLGQ